MEQILDFIGTAIRMIMSLGIGAGVMVAILYPMYRLHVSMWERVAAEYQKDFDAKANPTKLFGAVAIAESGLRWPVKSNKHQRAYPPVHVTLLPEGIGIRMSWLFSLGMKPLVLPFSEMELASTRWALWGHPVAIRMKGVEGVDIILYREALEWLADRSPVVAALMANAQPEPSGQAVR